MISGQKNAEDSTQSVAMLGRGGEMGDRIRGLDWSKTPLGPIQAWPQSLRTVVNILISSRYQMWMAWGPELTMFYNDAYRPTLGIKHPSSLGKPARDVWPEIWSDIGPLIETVLTSGTATYDEGLRLFLERSGFPEETYHTFSYSPLADDDGGITGMLCVVTEETDRVIGDRRVKSLRDVAAGMAGTNTEAEVLQVLRDQLSRNQKDLPFTLTYLYDAPGYDAKGSRLASCSGIAGGHPLAPERIEPGSDFPWPAHQLFLHPASWLMEDLEEQGKIAPLPAGDWNKPANQAAIVPIRQQGQEEPAGFFVVGLNPYRRYDAAYSGFVDLLAGQIAAGLGNARAYDAARQRAEALAEIDRAKTTFFSNVSHELRTPLTLMLSPVEELLAQAGERPPAERDLLHLVHRNALRLQKLVNTLLDFSRIEAGRMQATYEPVNLALLTADLAANFRSAMHRAGLNFEIACAPLAERVYVDREMWEKIVLNLLSNALKYTFQGRVRVAVEARGDFVELTVEDTGTGIPEAEMPHIFERFHRVEGAKGRTIEGTGIGLALVQELVKLHGGSVRAESRVSQGTKFTVSIPLGKEHLAPDKIREPHHTASTVLTADSVAEEAVRWSSGDIAPVDGNRPSPSGCLERVLLADDNADMREYVTRLLSGRYRVSAVSSGEEALRQAVADPPDLILSDVMMPGLDGFGLLTELRAHAETRTIPVVLLSARAGEESRVEGLGAGADDYLIKPFTARELLARVGAHISMRRRRHEAEEALRESQATLQSFYDSSPFLMGVTELDADRVVQIYVNAATVTCMGAGGNAGGVPLHVKDLWREQYLRSQAEGRFVRFEYEHPLVAGACWLDCCVNFLGIAPTGRPRFSYIAEDVTDRKRNEELLQRSNLELRRANADLEQFAYSASHDLQEPLRQIAVYSQLLEKRFGSRLEGKGLQYLGYCVEGAHRMGMLISGLLDYSQVSKAANSPVGLVNMSEVMETVRKNLATTIEEAGAVITVGDLPSVHGHAAPLVHLLQNLVSNAVKYSGEKRPLVAIGAVAEDGRWRFSVKDNGIGIPQEYQSQIFGIFKRLHDQTEYPGTGIGLAICQKIVERSGGRIWVESEPASGSTFFFTLPAADHENTDHEN